MSSDPIRLERRAAQRFDVHSPLAVHFNGQTVPGFIQNLSGRGVFFYAETSLPEGAIVELTFTMPSEVTLAESMPVRCRGRVIRSSAAANAAPVPAARTGFAVRFDSYEYLQSEDHAIPFVRVSAASIAGSPSSASR
jgi:hypothetical protein